MDQSTLVGDQIDEGRRFVERFAADGNQVQAAFWVKTAEDGNWFLYVVTELVERAGPAVAYRAVHAALRKLGEAGVPSSQIKVIGPNNLIAKDVLSVMARHPGRLATQSAARTLGSMAVDQCYIYPSRFFSFTQGNPMTTEEIGGEILRLMNRVGSVQPSRIALKDGTAFNGVPFAVELGTQKAMVARFLADGEAVPRVVRLDEIASIS